MKKKAVVLFSGGLDSTTCLAQAQSAGLLCYALSFSYEQRHAVELVAARKIAASMGVCDHKIVHLDIGQFGGSALTDLQQAVPAALSSPGIPTTYVPARNLIFLSIALGYAETIGATEIILGINSVDYSQYPDCRSEFIAAFQSVANIATKAAVEGVAVTISAPLLHLSKAEIIQAGILLGVDYANTCSCYQPTVDGEACGMCDSCYLRQQGFLDAGVVDPTRYAPQR